MDIAIRKRISGGAAVAALFACLCSQGALGQQGGGDPAVRASVLLRRAREGLATIPGGWDVVARLRLAQVEAKAAPAASVADAERAFQTAEGMSAGASGADDSVGTLAASMPMYAENGAVQFLAGSGHEPVALALARRSSLAGGDRARLYDSVLVLAKDAAWLKANALQVASECQHATGIFPYQGGAGAIRRAGLDAPDKAELARMGIATAGSSRTAAQLQFAAIFLESVHRAMPRLDGEIGGAIASMLTTLGGIGTGADRPLASQTGRQLMGMLQQIDPDAANRERIAHPEFGLGLPPLPGSQGPMSPVPRPTADAAGLFQQAAGTTGDLAYRLYAQSADAASGNAELASAASDAAEEIAEKDKEVVARTPEATLQLCRALKREGKTRAWRSLLGQLLAAEASAMNASERAYSAGSLAEKAKILQLYRSNRFPGSEFGRAAAVDFGAAADAALLLPDGMWSSMTLLAVAANAR